MRAYILAILLILILILAIDWALYRYLKIHFQIEKQLKHLLFKLIYWLTPCLFIGTPLLFLLTTSKENITVHTYHHLTLLNGILIAIYLAKATMLAFYIISGLTSKSSTENSQITKNEKGMTRAQFLGKMGLIIGAIPFSGIMYNISKGRFNFTVHRSQVALKSLPKSLEGLRIVQLSDIHLGNFNFRYEQLNEVISKINSIKPDLIFITGDLVNNFASETDGWEDIFGQLKAKHGKYAILGNHDYGDYSEWKSPEMKIANFNNIKKAIANFGFELLLNSNKTININNTDISLIGVENWGHPPFPRYGDLQKAMQGDLSNFKILLTHDPDHWEAEVSKHTNINLTLSGHTHGMQVGLRFKNKEWSPAKWKYKYWGGLYKVKEQYLYVNRGLGFVGIPLRIGMPPEITLLELKKAQ